MPKKLFEVIVVDDFSEDDTFFLVKNFLENNPKNDDFFNLKLLAQTHKNSISPKKQALYLALQEAEGDIVVQTDGDCVVGEDWLAEIWVLFEQKNAVLVSGAVVFFEEKNIFQQIQTLEFATLIAVGAVTLSQKNATMANGANLAYLKKVFEEVGGYADNMHIASGDDEFLLQKIAKKYPKNIFFLKSKNPPVKTKPQTSIQDFIQQRRRWASKWRFYADFTPKILAIFVFLVNFFTILLMGECVFNLIFQTKNLQNQGFLLIRWGAEFLLLGKLLHDFRRLGLVWLIPITQLFYPFYVVLVGLLAQKKGFVWKGRHLK